MAYDDAKNDFKNAGHEAKDATEEGVQGVKDTAHETEAELEKFAQEDK